MRRRLFRGVQWASSAQWLYVLFALAVAPSRPDDMAASSSVDAALATPSHSAAAASSPALWSVSSAPASRSRLVSTLAALTTPASTPPAPRLAALMAAPEPRPRANPGYWTHNESAWMPTKFLDFDHLDESGRRPSARTSATPRPADPVFDTSLVTDVSVPLGATAVLHCRVRNLAGRPVSWVRRRDWHILTSGPVTYTNDDRFHVVSSPSGTDWSLHIKYVQKRDNGTYECQVATGSGTMSHYFNLLVLVPKAFILGSGDYHIGEGSTISLVCIIENSPLSPQYVFWRHNDREVGVEGVGSTPGVSVVTEPGPKTHSRLVVSRATTAHSGNYTCGAPGAETDTINVFVSEGDNTAAIQRQSASAAPPPAASRRPSWLQSAPVLLAAAAAVAFSTSR
ncbi:hemicentin-2-like [Schistocerca cancellata]|uniref:hemicentin-2-like n=1 Tax=Schistocerca cancellata TaxID=274614 RepID=UPI002118F4B5|nr:hemicentin-2-like [Schistocerca cancellata]